MDCNLEISKFEKDAVLYRDQNGKIICVKKEEFLKPYLDEIKNLKLEVECCKNNFELFKLSTQKELDEKISKINIHLAAIRSFIEIMKG